MDFLKEYLGEELYDQVSEKLKDNDKVKLANLAEGKYVSKDKFLAAENSANDLQTEIAERDTALADLKKSIEDGDTDATKVKADLEALQTKHAEAKVKFEAGRLDDKIDLLIIKAGAKNVKSVKAHVEKKKVTLVEGKVVGLDEQLKTISNEHKYLFGEFKPNLRSDPPNPPAEDDGDQLSEWQEKLDAAKKSGSTLETIKVKQAAKEAGVIVN